jgi:hypothetical protein
MCKYGDFFLYLDIDERLGVQSVVGLPTHEIERLEGEDKSNPKYVQFQWNSGGLTFEYAPYGTSVLEPARRIFRQLILLEDAMMSYRIVRAPERRVFYIDVGNVAPNDVEQYMQKVMTQMKRNQVVDSNTGRVDLRYNPMSTEEDYFIPVRGGVSSRIENLPGGTYTGDIDDVKYLRDKLFSALKVPASYLTNLEGADEDKTTLAQKDIRFARTIQRLQRSIITELEKVGIIHLYTLGYKGADLISFKTTHPNSQSFRNLSTGRLSSMLLLQQPKAFSLVVGLQTTSLTSPKKSSFATSAKCSLTVVSTQSLRALLRRFREKTQSLRALLRRFREKPPEAEM